MSFFEILTDNYIVITEVVGLWAMLGIGVHLDKRTVKVTRAVLLLILFEALIYSLERWTQTFETMSIARPLLTASIYMINPLIMTGIMEMATPLSKKSRITLCIPLVISAVILYTSQWTHLIFIITDDNHWIGNGNLSYYPYFLEAIYIIVFIYYFIKKYINYDLRIRACVIYIVIAGSLGVLFHVLFKTEEDYSTLYASIVILYNLFIYIQAAKADPLTGMLNRQCYYQDSARNFGRLTGIASVDMNELKWINDNFGHEAGDKAIKAVAGMLMKDTGRNKSAYRVGGDEFVILYYGVTEDDMILDIEMMRGRIDSIERSCAFGYALKGPGDNIDTILAAADEKMYADKEQIKKTMALMGQEFHFRD